MPSSSLPIPLDKKAMRMNLYDLKVAMSSEYYDQRTKVMLDRVSSQLRLSPRLHSPLSPSFSDDDSSPTNSAFIKYGKNTQYRLHDTSESRQETLDAECLFDMDKENDDILRFEEDDTQGHECGDSKKNYARFTPISLHYQVQDAKQFSRSTKLRCNAPVHCTPKTAMR